MKVTYYLETISSWCHWVEPTWTELKRRYDGRVDFQWKIALMPPEAFPVSRKQADWFYQRSGTVMKSSYMLNSGWLDPELHGDYGAPNLVAEAGRDFGINDDRLRLAIANAAVLEGKQVGRLDVAVAVGAAALGLDPTALRTRAASAEVRARLDASTAEFLSHQIDQRPAFVITDPIGDKAVFSGLVRLEPLVATIDAMLADTAAYASHKAHFGSPPSQ